MIDLELRGGWWRVTAPAPQSGPGDWWARGGPFQPVPGVGQVCDLPGDIELQGAAAAPLRDWLVGSCEGGDPCEGRDPTVAIPTQPPTPGELAARSGPFLCQGRFVSGKRTYIDYRVGGVVTHLPKHRQDWLAAILARAAALRLVRVGIDPADGAVHARVDLSGCPAPWLDLLLGHATRHLRAAVAWLLPSITLITDAGVESQALRRGAPANPSNGEDR